MVQDSENIRLSDLSLPPYEQRRTEAQGQVDGLKKANPPDEQGGIRPAALRVLFH